METKRYIIICVCLLIISLTTSIQAQELWGTTESGGDFDHGIIFEWGVANPGFFNTNFSFVAGNSGATQTGRNPSSGLLLASNGNLYGMTSQGGLNGRGTLFEYNHFSDYFS
jgi:uncharacterized repeat protein (TIGR03803 family)